MKKLLKVMSSVEQLIMSRKCMDMYSTIYAVDCLTYV